MKFFIAFVAAMAVLSFVLYGVDKFKAKLGARRIRESVLLGFGFFGGAIGALLGMMIFRHKTKHWYFWIVNFFGLCAVAVAYFLISTL